MWITFQNPIIALAPMADMTDGPFCEICRDVSGKRSFAVAQDDKTSFVVFREMASSEAIARGNEKTLRMCEFKKTERPIVIQIFGSDPITMAEAGEIIYKKFKPDGIDINMGCPVPKITGKNKAGAALMKDHERACAIVRALKEKKLAVPISVKTRLGWNKEDEILEFAPKLEAVGADLITIHGRTQAQGYSGRANWEMISNVKKLLKIPVIANGDIVSRADIANCLAATKADGVMIGRGALGHPWIFNFKKQFSSAEKIDVILRHAQAHLAYYGEKSITAFRKHLAYYCAADNFPRWHDIKRIRARLVRVNSYEELEEILMSSR